MKRKSNNQQNKIAEQSYSPVTACPVGPPPPEPHEPLAAPLPAPLCPAFAAFVSLLLLALFCRCRRCCCWSPLSCACPAPVTPSFSSVQFSQSSSFLSQPNPRASALAHASLPCLRIRCIYFGSPARTRLLRAFASAVPPLTNTHTHTHTFLYYIYIVYICICISCTFSAGVALSIFYF